MNRLFFDMDGVIVDFTSLKEKLEMTGDELKGIPGAFLMMLPYEDAIDGVKAAIGMGFDVFLATKPPTGYPQAYADKVAWVLKHLPELKRKIILTHDKGLLGDSDDILVDDRPHKANCQQFKGKLIEVIPHSVTGEPNWRSILEELKQIRDARKGIPAALGRMEEC